jgi:hypothetical protein
VERHRDARECRGGRMPAGEMVGMVGWKEEGTTTLDHARVSEEDAKY